MSSMGVEWSTRLLRIATVVADDCLYHFKLRKSNFSLYIITTSEAAVQIANLHHKSCDNKKEVVHGQCRTRRLMTAPGSGGCGRLAATTLSLLINNCRSMRGLEQIHAHIITSSSSSTTATMLLTRILFFAAISDVGSLPYATTLFHTTPAPTLFMYNTMIRAHSTRDGSLGYYKLMLSNGIKPDHITFPFLLKYCSHRGMPSFSGQSVHAHVAKLGFGQDLFVQNATIGMYAAVGSVWFAVKVFDEMPTRDVVSWNSVLIGCLRCGELDFGLDLFGRMDDRNIVSWNSVVTGLVQGGRPREALRFFHEMLVARDGGVRPDKITVAGVVSACASLGALDQGRWVHGNLKRCGLEFDAAIGTALVDMYGKCGCIERAIEVFNEMPKKDVLAWTAMISAFAVNGHGEKALALLPEMEKHGLRPNYVTFGALLSACAHSGFLTKGQQCFEMMRKEYGIEPNPQHYACMVDLLGRAGLFKEALGLITNMPMEPDVYVLGALLGGCLMHGNADLGKKLAEYLIAVDPNNHAFYIILSDIYAKAGRFRDVKRIRNFMVDNGIKKTSPGCSMIEVEGMVYEFSVNGAAEVSMEKIILMLNMITDELKFVDYALQADKEPLETDSTASIKLISHGRDNKLV